MDAFLNPADPDRRSPARVRLAVADPSLVDGRGHHYSLTLQVTRGAQALGIEVVWLTHKDFAMESTPQGVAICPVFSATMYDRYRPQTKDTLPPDLERRLLDELHAGIERCALQADDHVFFHTGFGDLYRALPGYVSGGDWRRKPLLHVCTPYDHATMPGKDPGNAVLEVLHALRGMPAVDRKLFFWAETPQLATHYVLTYGFNVRALPLPPATAGPPPAPATAGAAATALYLGAAREEKGFTLLPALARRLYDTHGRDGRLRFVIQCSPQIIGYKPSIREAIDALRGLPAGYVELIDTVMDEHDYHARMAESDIVLLLYDRKGYRIRGSGIAVEAICADKCLLTHRGTFCASLLTDGGGVAADSLDDAVDGLASLVDNLPAYRVRAARQGQAYRARNSVERYVQRLLDRAHPGLRTPLLPSSLIGQINYPLLRGA